MQHCSAAKSSIQFFSIPPQHRVLKQLGLPRVMTRVIITRVMRNVMTRHDAPLKSRDAFHCLGF